MTGFSAPASTSLFEKVEMISGSFQTCRREDGLLPPIFEVHSIFKHNRGVGAVER